MPQGEDPTEDRAASVEADAGQGTHEGSDSGAPGAIGRRRAFGLGALLAAGGAVATALATAGVAEAQSGYSTSGTGGSGTAAGGSASAPSSSGSSSGSAAAAAGTAAAPPAQGIGVYTGPEVPSTYQATLTVTSATNAPAPPVAPPAELITKGQINSAFAYSSGAVGYLGGALALAAWSNRHPKVTFQVVNSLFSGAGGGEVPLLTQLAGGTAPDVFPAYGDSVAPYVTEGALADITKYTDAWPEFQGMLASIRNQMIVAGKVYGIPLGAPSGYVMVYRKDLFDEANVPYPTPDWTTNDYVSRATAISQALSSKKVWGTNILWQYTNWYFAEFAQAFGVPMPQYFFYIPNGSGDGFAMAPPTEIARVLTFYQTLVNNGAALYGSSETLGTLNNDLGDGRVAMTLRQTKQLGGAFLSNIGQAGFVQPDQIGIVPVPRGSAGLRNYDLRATPVGINSAVTGDKLTLAFEYLKDMNGPRGSGLALAVNGLQGVVPPYPSAYPGTAYPASVTSVFPASWIQTLESDLVLNIPLPPAPNSYGVPGSMPTGSASGCDRFIQQILTDTSADAYTVAQDMKSYIEGTILNTPIPGLAKSNWHAYYKALGAYFLQYYPAYYDGPYTQFYKQYETF